MKIKFATDRINEYHNGNFHAVNDGTAVEVKSDLGNELLNAKHSIDGEWVPVFEKVNEPVQLSTDLVKAAAEKVTVTDKVKEEKVSDESKTDAEPSGKKK